MVASRAAARCRLQHRVRRRVERAERAEPALSARVHRPGAAPPLRPVEREVPRARRQRPDPGALGGRRSERRSRRERPRRDPTDARRRLLAQLPDRLEDDDVTADKVVLALPFSILRRGRLSAGRFLRPEAEGDQASRHGDELEAARPVHARPWNALGATATRSRTRLPEHLGGVARAAGARGSSWTTRAGTSARASARAPGAARTAVPRRRSSPCCPG